MPWSDKGLRVGRILIVDDSVLIRELLVATLSADGHEPRIAVDGVEAVRSVRDFRPDLIILDWVMPRLDGIGCLRCLRRNRETRDIPVIMLAGSVTRELVLEAVQHGIGGFFSKEDLSLTELRQRVRDLLAAGTPAATPDEVRVATEGSAPASPSAQDPPVAESQGVPAPTVA